MGWQALCTIRFRIVDQGMWRVSELSSKKKFMIDFNCKQSIDSI